MLKKTITYTDYDGVERTEDFYFNLSKAEVVEMELGVAGGLTEMITRVVSAQDRKQIFDIFKEFIVKSYGEKSPDGKRFIKSKEISDSFTQTEAYSELLMDLASDANALENFMNAIIPKVPNTPSLPELKS